jgi:hypothetical protein
MAAENKVARAEKLHHVALVATPEITVANHFESVAFLLTGLFSGCPAARGNLGAHSIRCHYFPLFLYEKFKE